MTSKFSPKSLIIALSAALAACNVTTQGPCDQGIDCTPPPPGVNWSQGADLPFTVMEFGATVLSGAIYIGGGLDIGTVEAVDSFLRYDPGADTWTTLTPMPDRRNLMALVAVGDSIYAIGGQSEQIAIGIESNLWIYIVDEDRWESRASLPNEWAGGGATVVNGEIVVVGGFGLNSIPQGAVLIYNPTTDSWREGEIIPTVRQRLGVAAIGSLVYAMGGRSQDSGTEFDVMEIYDVDNDVWTTGQAMPVTARAGLSATALDGVLHVFGGSGSNTVWNLHQTYDPLADVWTTMGDGMPTARFELRAIEQDGLIYTMGGVSIEGLDAQLEIFNPNP